MQLLMLLVGFVSPEVSETLAKELLEFKQLPIIDSAEVQVIPGALQERVVGSLSPTS